MFVQYNRCLRKHVEQELYIHKPAPSYSTITLSPLNILWPNMLEITLSREQVVIAL